MLDDADNHAPEFDPPDEEAVYERYLGTRRWLNVAPMPRDRSGDLLAEWSAALAADAWNRRYGVQ